MPCPPPAPSINTHDTSISEHTRTTDEAAIPPLPAHLLPPPECKGKGGGKGKKKQKKTKKERVQEAAAAAAKEEEEEEEGKAKREGEGIRKEGLEKTVEEMLRDYVPASVEGKRPFYCRVCRFQGARCVFFVGGGWASVLSLSLRVGRRKRGFEP